MKLASRILAGSVTSLVVLVLRPSVTAAPSEARVTQIVRDVKLLPSEAEARPAAVNDVVSEETGVRTGGDSRSELTFSDLTITRLGADTIFSFSKAGRTAKVESGSILLRVPKDSRGGAISSNIVTVAITGTTVIFESDHAGNSKLITLEGRARLSFVKSPRNFRNVRAGQRLEVPASATTLPLPVEIDLDQVMKTHPLITDFGPLPSRDLIAAAAQEQHNSSPSRRPDIRPSASPSPWATRPRPTPSPTPPIVTPTPTRTPSPSVTPPKSPTPSPSPTATSPKESPTPSPGSFLGNYNGDWTRTPNPSPTRYPFDPTPPIVTPTPKPTPSPFASIGPRVTPTPFKPAPSSFPIRRSTPIPTPTPIRTRVTPTPNPRVSPSPIKRSAVSPTPKNPKPTPTPS
jgi:FecR protein